MLTWRGAASCRGAGQQDTRWLAVRSYILPHLSSSRLANAGVRTNGHELSNNAMEHTRPGT
eukprot:1918080-Pleurochrysis_carterae.AAC.3